MHSSGACDKDAPDPVEAVLSGREAEQEGQVHQGREETLLACQQYKLQFNTHKSIDNIEFIKEEKGLPLLASSARNRQQFW